MMRLGNQCSVLTRSSGGSVEREGVEIPLNRSAPFSNNIFTISWLPCEAALISGLVS